jgi:hypothetical protein
MLARAVLSLFFCGPVTCALVADQPVATCTLTDHLNRNWVDDWLSRSGRVGGTWTDFWIATDEAPDVNANPVRVKGRFAADLVVFLAEGPDAKPTSQQITRRAGASGFASQETTQRSLQWKMPPGQPLTAVLYPVMKDQPTPQFTVLPGGRVIRIASSFGTDYAWLSLEGFRFSGEGLDLQGKAGAVQVRPGGVRISLPQRGKVVFQGRTLENRSGGAVTASQKW